MPDKFGTVIIKATMADDESVYSEMEVTVEEGEAMSPEQLNSILTKSSTIMTMN